MFLFLEPAEDIIKMATLQEIVPFIVMAALAFGVHNAIHKIEEGMSFVHVFDPVIDFLHMSKSLHFAQGIQIIFRLFSYSPTRLVITLGEKTK